MIISSDPNTKPSSETLLEIIKTQTDIAKLELDLSNVMNLVTLRSQCLTGAVSPEHPVQSSNWRKIAKWYIEQHLVRPNRSSAYG